MRIRLCIMLIITLIGLFPVLAQDTPAITYQSGLITGEETWSDTIILTGDVTLTEGATLNVDAGTLIYILPNFDSQSNQPADTDLENAIQSITIDARAGTLNMSGRNRAHITMVALGNSTEANQWGGIYMEAGRVTFTDMYNATDEPIITSRNRIGRENFAYPNSKPESIPTIPENSGLCFATPRNEVNLLDQPTPDATVIRSLASANSLLITHSATDDNGNLWWQLLGEGYVNSSQVELAGDCELANEGNFHHLALIDDRFDTGISGEITQDTEWSGNILLSGDIWLSEGVTLTILPGTRVTIRPHTDRENRGEADSAGSTFDSQEWAKTHITIDGRAGILQIIGTAEERIMFQPLGDVTEPAQWDGILVSQGTIQYADFLYTGRQAIALEGDTGITEIAYNHIFGFGDAGIHSNSSDTWIHHNTLENGNRAIIPATDNIIENNHIINTATGIQIDDEYSFIRNNLIVDTSIGIEINNGRQTEITNNTLAWVNGAPDGNITGISNNSHSILILRNNIIFGDAQSGLELNVPPAQNSNISYNMFFNTEIPISGDYREDSSIREMNVISNPRFVSAVRGDYHLLNTSPAIDTGHPADFDTDGSPADFGVFGGNHASGIGHEDSGAIACIASARGTINVRQGASTSHNIARVLQPSETVPIIGAVNADDGYTWYQITDGEWVREDVVIVEEGCNRFSPKNQ